MPASSYSTALERVRVALDGPDLAPLDRDVRVYAEAHDSWCRESDLLLPSWDVDLEDQSPQLAAAFQLTDRIDAMLRSAILFGDLANARLLQTVFSHRQELTVNGLSSDQALRPFAASLRPDALTEAHALRIYRNQIVAHFGAPRRDTVVFRYDTFASRRLAPIDFGGATDENHRRLQEIADRHLDLVSVPAVGDDQTKQNFWDLLEALFYSLRPIAGTERNPDRKTVDEIAIHGGIRSPTMAGVVDTLTNFTDSVAECLESGEWPLGMML